MPEISLKDEINKSCVYIQDFIPNSMAYLVSPYLHICLDDDCVNHISNQVFVNRVNSFVESFILPFGGSYEIVCLDFNKKHIILKINSLL